VNSEVDVVIPTFRRPEALASCLASLERQTLLAKSIEIVDDSELDQGPGISRNIGWRRGSAKYVAFIDDDCIADESWIENIQEMFHNNDLGGIEGSITTTGQDGEIINFDSPNRLKWDRFKTANMAVRRDVLEQIGGFDERYYLHREDTDLAWRVIDAGNRMAWAPQCRVHHPEPLGWHEDGIPGSSKFGAYPRSEQLLYHCNPRKFVECAAGMISRQSVMNGNLRKLRREMKMVHEPGGVEPLTFTQSWSLWTRAWLLAVFWAMRRVVNSEPVAPRHSIDRPD